jgi:hypothetical protein
VRIEGECSRHGLFQGGMLVSQAMYEMWQLGKRWDEEQFIEVLHMGFYLEPTPFWVTREEYKPLNLPLDYTLNDEETETFLEWVDDKTRIIRSCCFQEWKSGKTNSNQPNLD